MVKDFGDKFMLLEAWILQLFDMRIMGFTGIFV
jgi:hypothetical protein